ncbi:MAG TPA: NUDIX hydrolase [Terracidiphilus sp.]|jgi:hypothetical protein|nr:NUDIX hydrolase [Terracidiphilus sp.]
MPIPDVPVYFLTPPAQGLVFSAFIERTKDPLATVITKEASEVGFDWKGFRDWRWFLSSQGYYGKAHDPERGVRCISNPTFSSADKRWISTGHPVSYRDYVCSEHSAGLCAPGVLPNMRRLFDGDAWDIGSLDLDDVPSAAARYSLFLSISALILTDDGYFVLQRRSNRVETGRGSLGASFAGGVHSKRDRSSIVTPTGVVKGWDLRETTFREMEEELGLSRDDISFDKTNCPFIGAAFNLRYGRDLNFYALCKTRLRSYEIGVWNKGDGHTRESVLRRGRWETERLEYLNADRVTENAIVNGKLESHLVGRSRHLLGALYSWAVYTGN